MTNWKPSALLVNLQTRAKLIRQIRDFFFDRDVLEVYTPILGSSTTSTPAIQSFVTRFVPEGGRGESRELFLQTSPEYPMKRLLASGSGPIYQLGPVFRNGEAGRKHQPEFWMLEWYRPHWALTQLIQEMSDLLQHILECPPIQIYPYQYVFQALMGLDPHRATQEELVDAALEHKIIQHETDLDLDVDGWLDCFMTHIIEPNLSTLTKSPIAITDYPKSQAALARVSERQDKRGTYWVGERFEVYFDGLELANGYDELTDPVEQRRRFQAENLKRQEMNLSTIPVDEHFLDALTHGMPASSGVALGIDRLVMLALKARDISETLAFNLKVAKSKK